MNRNVYWIFELELQAGRDADFQALMAEMIDQVRANEPGTLAYEWSTSTDGKVCNIYERYADSAATMAHIKTFGARFAQRFFEILKPIRMTVYGAPDAAVKQALEASTPVYMQAVNGFHR